MKAKYIVVTGGVLSGIGKGIFSASLSRIFKELGIDLQPIKIDPYLNVDAGTMNPNQHGEVFVTEDGYEADLDLGHYERFLGFDMKRENNITAGQIYMSVIQKERKGEFLGSTVQMIPHVTGEIKSRIKKFNNELLIIEIGGTVGDIEGEIFLEAIRELALEEGEENFFFIHVTFVPYLKVTNEFKTKPTQQSVQLLRKIGIKPDMIVVRTEKEINEESIHKISLFGGVKKGYVLNLPDIENVYSIPEILYKKNIHNLINEKLKLNFERSFQWNYPKKFEDLKIAMIAKYLGTDDAYKSIIESLKLAGVKPPKLINAESLEYMSENEVKDLLGKFNGIIIPGGFGKRGIEGKIKAIKYARENKVPILGLCLGMQIMVIEFARNVFLYKSANSTEFDPDTPYPVIDLMEDQKKILNLGGTMRLGSQKAKLTPNTVLWKIYNEQDEIFERHRHRYEVNFERFQEMFSFKNEKDKLTISAISNFVEAVELVDHPFFLGVQFHPEYKSKVGKPHPIFKAFVKSVREYMRKNENF